MIRVLALLVLLILPVPAQAGAWLREKGAIFLSWSNSIPEHANSIYETDMSLYAEYGLTKHLTVGFDGYLGGAGTKPEAYLFMRFPIGNPKRPAKMALTFGVGYKEFPNPWGTVSKQTRTKLGFSWGRGLKKGWLAFDASASILQQTSLVVPGQDGTNYSADFTWGQKPWERWMFIWQVQSGKTTNGPFFAKFTPSVVWAFGEKRNNNIEVGLIKGLTGSDVQSVKLGFWKSF